MIKPKTGKCIQCGKEGYLTAKRCSTTCYWQYRSSLKEKPKERTVRKPINKVSDKLLEKQIEYAKLRKQWLPKHPVCEIGLNGCTIKALQIHHAKGREGELLTDTRYWKATCAHCHQVITENSALAIQEGHSISRHKKQDENSQEK